MSTQESASFDELIAELKKLPQDSIRRVLLHALEASSGDELDSFYAIEAEDEEAEERFTTICAIGYIKGNPRSKFTFFPFSDRAASLEMHYALCDAVLKVDAFMPSRKQRMLLDETDRGVLAFAMHGATVDGEELLVIWHPKDILPNTALTVIQSVAKTYRNFRPSGN